MSAWVQVSGKLGLIRRSIHFAADGPNVVAGGKLLDVSGMEATTRRRSRCLALWSTQGIR